MINTNKQFVKMIVITVLVSILSVWLFNFIIDPYGKNNQFIFKGNKNKKVRDERSQKFDLIMKNSNASSFMFGSSRALMLDAKKLSVLTKTDSLNLAFSSASAGEYYLYIKYLIETRKVSNIIIGIDLFAYTKNFISNGIMPPKLLNYFGMDDGSSIKTYLSSKMFSDSIATFKKNILEKPKNISQYTNRGKIVLKQYLKAKKNKADFQKYILKYVVNDYVHWGSKTAELSSKQLNYLYKIKSMCDNNDVKLYLFMSPLYIKQIKMKNNRFKQQQNLLKYIVENINPVMDYNGITSINTDPYSFADSFHYSYGVADYILEMFFLKKEKHSEFYITKENINSYIESTNKKLFRY